MANGMLAGRAILVVEDEYWIASDLRRELAGSGAVVIGPAPSLAGTIDLIEATPHLDAAILDINLQGEAVFPAADLLERRGVPFLFATGYEAAVIPARFGGVLRCGKPTGFDKILRTVAMLIERR